MFYIPHLLFACFILFGCAGKKETLQASDYFIPYRNDIFIRNVLNYSSEFNLDFIVSDELKKFFGNNSFLPLNNYDKTASLIADVEIMDYKTKLFRANNAYNEYIYWAKFRVTLMGPRAEKVFIDRLSFTLGKKIDVYPFDRGRETEVGNKALFQYLGKNIINLVKIGRVVIDYDYDMDMM